MRRWRRRGSRLINFVRASRRRHCFNVLQVNEDAQFDHLCIVEEESYPLIAKMKNRSIVLILIGIVIATIKVCHKNRDRMDWLPTFGAEEEKSEYMSSSEIRKYAQGSWKSRNTYPDAKIAIKGQTLILTRGESRIELNIISVKDNEIRAGSPNSYWIKFFADSKDMINITHIMDDEDKTFVDEYYDRIVD